MDNQQIKNAVGVVRDAFVEQMRKDRQLAGDKPKEMTAQEKAFVAAVTDLATNVLQNLNDIAYAVVNIDSTNAHRQ